MAKAGDVGGSVEGCDWLKKRFAVCWEPGILLVEHQNNEDDRLQGS